MNRLRRLAIVLVALGLITSAIYATGAFSSLTASRNADVRVAGDAAGYLALEPAHKSKNSVYASYNNGKLQISLTDMAETSGSGGGVNPSAVTTVQNVFTITNQGAQPVAVWLADESAAVSFQRGTSGVSIEKKGQAVQLKPGKSVTVTIVVDTRHVKQGATLRPMMTLHASTDVAGTPANSGGGDSDGGQASSPPTESKESQQNNKKTKEKQESKQKSADKDDGGGLLDGVSHAVKNPGETFSDAGKAVNDFVHGVSKSLWKTLNPLVKKAVKGGRDLSDTALKMGNKLLNSPIDVLREAAAGLLFGGLGMPGGAFTAKESSSPYYFLSWMGSTIVPIVDIFTGMRDLADNAAQGKLIGAGVELVGLIPAVGKGADVAKSIGIAETWLGPFASKADEAMKMLNKGYLSKLVGENKNKLLDKFPGRSSSASKAGEIPESRMNIYIHEGYNPARIDHMVRNGKFTDTDIRNLVGNNANLKWAEELQDKGVSVKEIRYYAKNDIDLRKVDALKKKQSPQKFSREQTRTMLKNDFSPRQINHLKGYFTNDQITTFAKKGVDPERLKSMKADGWKNDQITTLVKKDVSQKRIKSMKADGWENDQITTLTRRGSDFKQAKKLKQDGLSSDDITEISENINTKIPGTNKYLPSTANLKKVRQLKGKGYSADELKYLTNEGISLTGVKHLDKYVSKKKIMPYLKGQKLVGYYSKCKIVSGWRNGHKNKDDDVPPIPGCGAEIDIDGSIG